MRFRPRLAVAVTTAALALAPFAATSAHAKVTKTFTGTIAISTAELSSLVGAGNNNGVGDLGAPARQTCPAPGAMDGLLYKFWDLKGDYHSAKLSGPKPAFGQDVGGLIYTNDYDLDLYALDAKCNLITGFASNTGGAAEKGSSKKAVRYIVAVYYSGPYPNIPVQVEVSS